MFSELVDRIVIRSGRPDRIADIRSYVHASIRECQMLAYFARDMTEDTITATAGPHIWERPANLRLMRTARYPGDIYPNFAGPGKRQLDEDYYYYGGSNYFAFSGIATGEEINVAYYSYAKRLAYYEDAVVPVRPAVYDEELETWTYLQAGSYVSTLGTDALDEAARNLVTNWLLLDWMDLIEEGGLAKIFKSVGDERSRTAFALFKSYQKDLKAGELIETLGV